jgi:predicted ATPase
VIQVFHCAGYKAFGEPVKLDTPLVTVFFGKNNSGKTTLVRLPVLIAASLTNPDSFYALSAHGLTFGSSFTDLTTASDPHPSIFLGIQWSARRRLAVTLQHVTSQQDADSVQPTFVQVDGTAKTIGLQSKQTETSRTLVDSVLNPSAVRRLDERIATLQALLDGLVHIPSARPRIQTIYAARPSTGWTVDEVPYILRSNRRVLNSVDDWFQQNLDGSGVDVDQAAFAFRLVETRQANAVNFTQSGRGLQSALPVVTLLLAVASGMRRSPLVIVEEPEAHLHPSVHGDMADLVLSCVGKSQLMIETHSENFLLRLRRRIAEGQISHNDVALYFVDDFHRVLRVPLDEFGGTDQWPLGIFESDVEEARSIVEAKISAMAATGDGK